MPISQTKCIDEVYYGIGEEIIKRVRKVCGSDENSALFTSNYSNTVIKIC